MSVRGSGRGWWAESRGGQGSWGERCGAAVGVSGRRWWWVWQGVSCDDSASFVRCTPQHTCHTHTHTHLTHTQVTLQLYSISICVSTMMQIHNIYFTHTISSGPHVYYRIIPSYELIHSNTRMCVRVLRMCACGELCEVCSTSV